MSITIGIDVGGSTTKIIGLQDKAIISPMCITAADPVSSLFGAFGRYLHDNTISLADIQQVMITGVGSKSLHTSIFGLPTQQVDEFLADGLGAQYETGLSQLIVVSMGTGTTLVRVDGNDIKHLGGLSMGGGTLQGLAQLLLQCNDIDHVVELAARGDSSNTHLTIQDICATSLEGLPMHATASLFGKVRQSHPNECDIAKGLITMVLETIGSCAVMSQTSGGFKDFVLIGNMTRLPECGTVFPMMEELYNVKFHIPTQAEYCTALGAALAYGR